MRTFDFSPRYRSTFGFDTVPSLLDSVTLSGRNQSSNPSYNIELIEEDHYRITLVVAGFVQDEIDIEVEKQTLTVKSHKKQTDNSPTFLHRGIAGHNFEQRFRLPEYTRVKRATLENGLLHIDLEKELPEAMRPRTIEIESGESRLIHVDEDQAA